MYTLDSAARRLGVSKWTVRRWIAADNMAVEIIETDRKRVYLTYNDLLTLSNKHRPLKIKLEPEPKRPELSGLYSVKDVAGMFGVDEITLTRWIKDTGIEKRIIATNRKRGYISDSDLVTLAYKYNRTLPDKPGMPAQAVGTEQAPVRAREHGPSVETRLYRVAEAALFLDVSTKTVKNWLALHHVEKKTVETDRGTIYITYSDVMMLATAHQRAGMYPLGFVADIREMRNRLEKIEASIVNLEIFLKEHRNYDKIMGH